MMILLKIYGSNTIYLTLIAGLCFVARAKTHLDYLAHEYRWMRENGTRENISIPFLASTHQNITLIASDFDTMRRKAIIELSIEDMSLDFDGGDFVLISGPSYPVIESAAPPAPIVFVISTLLPNFQKFFVYGFQSHLHEFFNL